MEYGGHDTLFCFFSLFRLIILELVWDLQVQSVRNLVKYMGLQNVFIAQLQQRLDLRLLNRHQPLDYHQPIPPQKFYFFMRRNKILALIFYHQPNGLKSGLHISWSSLHNRFFFPQTTYLHKHHHFYKSFSPIHVAYCPSTFHHIDHPPQKTQFPCLFSDRFPNLQYTISSIYSLNRMPNMFLDHVFYYQANHLHTCLHFHSIEFRNHSSYCFANPQHIYANLATCLAFQTHLHLGLVSNIIREHTLTQQIFECDPFFCALAS